MLELGLPTVLILLVFNYGILLILDSCPGVQETGKLWEANKMNGCVRTSSVKSAQKFTAQFFFREFYLCQRVVQ